MSQPADSTRSLPLRGWLTAEAISLTGTRVSMIAIPWLVLTTTHSPTQTGLVAFAEMAPYVAAKATAGPVIDRIGARRVSVTADLISAVVVGLIPLLHAWDLLTLPVLLVIVAMAGTLRGPGDGAKHALVPDLVDHAGVPMERATGWSGAVERLASTVGAAAAGGLVALIGPAPALALDAASFAVAAVVLWLSTRSLPAHVQPAPGAVEEAGGVSPRNGYFAQLREGWEFLRGDAVLVGIVAMVSVTNLLDQAYTAVLVPVWAEQGGGGAAAIGLLSAAFSGAAIGGSLVAAKLADRLPRYRTYVVAFLLAGLPRFVVLAFDSPMWAVLVVAVGGGFACGFVNPVLGAVIFERIPRPLVGRVTSLSSALCWSLIPFGGIVGGVLIAQVGLTTALLTVGTSYLLATMIPAIGPRLRAMDQAQTLPEKVPAA